ncbi:TPM domain-containing protein [Otariodibacter sp.]|uniref:TPM domain-containing protein n=1 Tax=Otariodibacter sp. TaxID=3030919 RepID=UPI0026161226|nr:TPM domain-containing protein [Otariodibacter sp.]
MGLFDLLNKKLPIDTQQIEQAISHLEKQTSAELRVVVERKVKSNSPIDRANQLFDELTMRETKDRNGVLIYLSFKPRLMAIVGDEGIHQKVGESFWESVYQVMKADCQNGDFTLAICKGIQQVEQQLKTYFPIQTDDKNELPNEVIIK